MSATKGSSRKSLASVKAEDGAGEDYTPQLSTPKGPAKKYDDDKIVRVKLLALQGHTPTQISKQLGMNSTSVNRFLGLSKDPRRSPARVTKDEAKHAEWAARAQALFASASPVPAPAPAPAPAEPVASGSGSKRAKGRGKKRATLEDDDDDDDATPAPQGDSPATVARTTSSGQIKKLRFAPPGELERVQTAPKPRLPQVVVRIPLVKARVILPPKKKPVPEQQQPELQPEAGPSSANTPDVPMDAAPTPAFNAPFASSGSIPSSYSSAFGSAPQTALPAAYSTSFGSQSTATAGPSSMARPSTSALAPTPALPAQPLLNGTANGHAPAAEPPLTTLSTLLSSLATSFPTTLAPHLPSNAADLAALGRLQPALAAALVDDLVEWAEQGAHKGLGQVVRRTEEMA